MSGSESKDAQVFNAVAQAGYKGQMFARSMTPVNTLKQALSPGALEGFMCGANAVEFDPPLTQLAKDLIATTTAKNGKWESPSVTGTVDYYCLKTALLQTGSVDTDKVAATLSSGMKYETSDGPAQIVSRPDFGNDRTVDSAATIYVKKVQNGNPVLVDTISVDQAHGYLLKAYPPLPPGATPGLPPGGPPGGGPPPGGSP